MMRNFSLVLSLISILLLIASCRDSSPERSETEKEESIEIYTKIISDPTGASAYIDDEFVGVTPLKMMKISNGYLRIELEGFKTIKTRIEDHGGEVEKVRLLEFELEPKTQ